MYNSVVLLNRKNNNFNQLLFTKKEFDLIKKNFFWIKESNNIIVNSEDYLMKKQLNIFKNEFKNIDIDFKLNNFYVFFYSNIYFFSTEDIFNNKFEIDNNKFCNSFLKQLSPQNGRPLFEQSEDVYLEWYHEYKAYKKYRYKDKITYFINPLTKHFLFRKESEYKNFIFKKNVDMKLAMEKINNKDMFIRLINVYDKETKNLKYRIINDEFFSSGLDTILKPYKGDEVYFFRSYLVTKKISNYIFKMYENKIEFNFDKNKYYLEVMSADDFIYDYNDFINDL